jgi:hypothetical protein
LVEVFLLLDLYPPEKGFPALNESKPAVASNAVPAKIFKKGKPINFLRARKKANILIPIVVKAKYQSILFLL